MILRRLTDALRRQDWFTVAIETLIVVLGVFLGLQVNNWNEARLDKLAEAKILNRLQQEVPALVASRQVQLGFSERRRDALESAVGKLFSGDGAGELDPFECLAVTLSHIYALPPDDSPVIQELVSAGWTDTLRDEDIQNALSSFLVARDNSRAIQRAVSIDIHQLALEYPDLISSVYSPGDGDTPPSIRSVCDLAGMRENRGFKNTLISNQQRYLIYFGAGFDEVGAELERLATALGVRLDEAAP